MELTPEKVNSVLRSLRNTLSDQVHAVAYSHLQNGDNDEAMTLWEEHYSKNPDDLDAMHHMALIYHELAIKSEREIKWTDSAQYWEKAMKLWPKLLMHKDFWSYYSGRVEDFSEDQAETLRKKLVKDILYINYRFYKDASYKSNNRRAAGHYQIIKNSDFPVSEIKSLLDRIGREVLSEEIKGVLVQDLVDQGHYNEAIERANYLLELDKRSYYGLSLLLKVLTKWNDALMANKEFSKVGENINSYKNNFNTFVDVVTNSGKKDILDINIIYQYVIMETNYYYERNETSKRIARYREAERMPVLETKKSSLEISRALGELNQIVDEINIEYKRVNVGIRNNVHKYITKIEQVRDSIPDSNSKKQVVVNRAEEIIRGLRQF